MAEKTNAVRQLDRLAAAYTLHEYDINEAVSGTEVAALLGQEPDMVFKTLVTVGKTNNHYVFMVPVAQELDLKKAAGAAKEKSIEMIPLKDLLPLTGYVHGGCSPIGMKKQFPTFIDETAVLFDRIVFSGGRRGLQIETSLDALQRAASVVCCDLAKS